MSTPAILAAVRTHWLKALGHAKWQLPGDWLVDGGDHRLHRTGAFLGACADDTASSTSCWRPSGAAAASDAVRSRKVRAGVGAASITVGYSR